MTSFRIWRAKNGRWMHGGSNSFRHRMIEEMPALLHQLVLFANDAACGGRPEADNRLGPDDRQLCPEPRLAGIDFRVRRLLMDAAFAALFELEVLHRIRDVHVIAIDTG